jgi:hypothetical protein
MNALGHTGTCYVRWERKKRKHVFPVSLPLSLGRSVSLSSACSLRTVAVAATTRKATTAGITTTNTTVASIEGRAHLSSVVHRRGGRVKGSELRREREREREREITAIVLVDVGVWLLNEHHYQLVEVVVVVMMMERALLRLLRSHALRASRVTSSSSLLQVCFFSLSLSLPPLLLCLSFLPSFLVGLDAPPRKFGLMHFKGFFR